MFGAQAPPTKSLLSRRSAAQAAPSTPQLAQQEDTERRKSVTASTLVALQVPSLVKWNQQASKWQLYLLLLSAAGALLDSGKAITALKDHDPSSELRLAPVVGEFRRITTMLDHTRDKQACKKPALGKLPSETRRVRMAQQQQQQQRRQQHQEEAREDIDDYSAVSTFEPQRRKPIAIVSSLPDLTERQLSHTPDYQTSNNRSQHAGQDQNQSRIQQSPRANSTQAANESRWIPMVEPTRPRRLGGERDQRRQTASSWRNQWRTPRLHQRHRISPSKMYKRVLLCDKTLVSLDYVRNLELEPRPLGSFDELDEFDDDDNIIELDSSSSADRRRLAYNMSSWLSVELESSASDQSQTSQLKRYSSNYLTDTDPLVRCDMWDLEKGSKNRKPPREILKSAVRADFNTVRDAINRCRQLSEKTLPPDDEYRDGLEVMSTDDLVSLFSIKRGLIPGTKWCGLGDQAHSYNDLGSKQRIDLCCRAHDHCPIRSKPFRNDYGLLNLALYTKSHCDCDADFYSCLRDVRSRTADMLGNLYFNIMKLQCLREERMKICREIR